MIRKTDEFKFDKMKYRRGCATSKDNWFWRETLLYKLCMFENILNQKTVILLDEGLKLERSVFEYFTVASLRY